jgi:hypothetical protein
MSELYDYEDDDGNVYEGLSILEALKMKEANDAKRSGKEGVAAIDTAKKDLQASAAYERNMGRMQSEQVMDPTTGGMRQIKPEEIQQRLNSPGTQAWSGPAQRKAPQILKDLGFYDKLSGNKQAEAFRDKEMGDYQQQQAAPAVAEFKQAISSDPNLAQYAPLVSVLEKLDPKQLSELIGQKVGTTVGDVQRGNINRQGAQQKFDFDTDMEGMKFENEKDLEGVKSRNRLTEIGAQGDVNASLQKLRINEKPVVPKTPGGLPIKPLEAGQQDRLTQVFNTAYTIDKMKPYVDNISGLKRGPIAGRLLGKNPYDADFQVLENLVNQIVPSMARGIFGEVGVLTDKDMDRYKKMLPQAKTDAKVASQIYDEIRDKIDSAYRITMNSYGKTRDVSGYDYEDVFAGARDMRGVVEAPSEPNADEFDSLWGN